MRPDKSREVVALIYFFCALIFLLSLVSFNPADPTIFNASRASSSVHNILGLFGAHLAWIFYNFFGIASFLIPLALIIMGIRRLRNSSLSTSRLTAFSMAFLLFFSCLTLPSLFWPTISVGASRIPTCGQLGSIITDFLVHIFSRTGAIIVLGGFVILAVSALSPWSLVEISAFLRDFFLNFLRKIVLFAGSLFSKFISLFERVITKAKRIFERKVAENIQNTRHQNMNHNRSYDGRDAVAGHQDGKEELSIYSEDEDVVVINDDDIELLEEVSHHETSPSGKSTRVVEFSGSSNKGKEEKVSGRPVFPANFTFSLPSVDLLERYREERKVNDMNYLKKKAEILTQKLADFGVHGEVVNILPGPVITMFEYVPAPGIKISKIVNLASDLTMALKALSIRIVAPIPGKAAVGIEIPNKHRELVSIRSIIESDEFKKAKAPLTITLGKDTVGRPVITDLARMPHLLIAGATGTGKSVCLNSILASLLFRNTPERLRLLLIDPKRIELSFYERIPHLIYPVVTDVKEATQALRWAVSEMEHRYELMADMNTRNIDNYNKVLAKIEKDKRDEENKQPMPYLVIIIDELADLMMVSSRDVEESITRLAQMARAAGIHLILATQRPSVDVITGLIKANIPSRISFQVSSKVDSRTILDSPGAETLLGAGDMLFLPPGTAKLQRIHGAFISEKEVKRITDYWRKQAEMCGWGDNYVTLGDGKKRVDDVNDEDVDEKYREAVELVLRTRQASISMLQRRLRVGYNRAARMIEMMEEQGIVGPSDGIKPREVLLPPPDDMD